MFWREAPIFFGPLFKKINLADKISKKNNLGRKILDLGADHR